MDSVGRGRSLALALGWGVLWGPLLGSWAILPHFLRTQRVHASSWAEWVLLDAVLLVVLAGFGAVASLLAWTALEAWSCLRGRTSRDATWAYGLAVPVSIPLLYFLVAALTELAIFDSLVGLEAYRPFFAVAALSYLGIAAALWGLYHLIVRLEPRPRASFAALCCTAATGAGLALAPLWGDSTLPVEPGSDEPQLVRGPATRSAAPLLFVGLDSGSWRVFQPLIDRGGSRQLEHLIASGIRGEMYAAWRPVWSAPAWAAILTGYPREETGIYQELAAFAPGLPPFQIPLEFDFLLDPLYLVQYRLAATHGYLRLTPYPRQALRRPPIWELLQAAGVQTGVVRFTFTYPASDRARFVISDHVGKDAWKLVGVEVSQASGLVAPVERAPELLASFVGPSPASEALLADLLPRGGPRAGAGAWATPAESLNVAAEIDQRTLDAAIRLVRSQPKLNALFVYFGGFDTVCHAFWRYRFPQDFPEDPPNPQAVREFAPVIDRYAEFLDDSIGRLVSSYATPPNVLIVADHGAEALHGNRTYSGAHSERDGVFIAAGPSIPHRVEMKRMSYFDVAPTVLDLLGFAPQSGMQGASVVAAVGTSG